MGELEYFRLAGNQNICVLSHGVSCVNIRFGITL
jgi:hypothetical protein